MDVGHGAGLLDINGAGRNVYCDNIAALCLRRLEFVAGADLGFLRRKPVSMNRPLLGSSDMPQELQSRDRSTFFESSSSLSS